MNKTEEKALLNEILKGEIFETVLIAPFLAMVLIPSCYFLLDTTLGDPLACMFIHPFITFLITVGTGMLGFEIIKCIKIKRSMNTGNYTYQYVEIDGYHAGGYRSSHGLYADYTYKGRQRMVESSTHKAKMVHVFECYGTVVAKVEENKDLLQ